LHPVDGLRGAGGHQAVLAQDLDHASQAGGRRLVAFQEAEGGDVDSELSGGREERGARRDLDLATVNREGRHLERIGDRN
jgi:hypothetical protein